MNEQSQPQVIDSFYALWHPELGYRTPDAETNHRVCFAARWNSLEEMAPTLEMHEDPRWTGVHVTISHTTCATIDRRPL